MPGGPRVPILNNPVEQTKLPRDENRPTGGQIVPAQNPVLTRIGRHLSVQPVCVKGHQRGDKGKYSARDGGILL